MVKDRPINYMVAVHDKNMSKMSKMSNVHFTQDRVNTLYYVLWYVVTLYTTCSVLFYEMGTLDKKSSSARTTPVLVVMMMMIVTKRFIKPSGTVT